MPKGYAYGNARLRAMRSRLLTEVDYSNLLAKTNIQEVITSLAEGPYREDIETALVRFEGVSCVFEAVRTNLTRTLIQVRSFYEDEAGHLVDLLLRRWDRHNLLAILRGQSQEVSTDSVLSVIVPVGQLDRVALRELARQPGLRAVIDLMATWGLPYATALRQVQARTGTVADLDQFELALNRFHYSWLREALSQGNGSRTSLLQHLQVEIDLTNLSTTLRLVHHPGAMPLVSRRYSATDIRPLLIEPGGLVSPERLAELVMEGSGLEGVVRGLSDTRYGPALERGWQRFQADDGGLAVLERELERWQAQHTAAMFKRNPLSIAIPIGYVGCKEIEGVNLRLIAQAVAWNIKREQVRPDLIFV